MRFARFYTFEEKARLSFFTGFGSIFTPARGMTRWRAILLLVVLFVVCETRHAQAQLLSSSPPPLEDEGSGTGSTTPDYESAAAAQYPDRGPNVKRAIEDSIRLLIIEHAVRVGTQDKTRQALRGPFFSDYHRSVVMPSQWGDTDSWLANYVGHPGQGAASGFIWLQNSASGQPTFAFTRDYLRSRIGATIWAAGYSVQFEIGPFSEASIGNVGMARETAGWVDYVMTPVGGLAIMIAEDALDRFVIEKLEQRTRSRVLRAMLRMFLNPSRATANVSGMRAPWDRPGRPIR